MMFIKVRLLLLFCQLTVHVLGTTQQSETHLCVSLALGSGMKTSFFQRWCNISASYIQTLRCGFH